MYDCIIIGGGPAGLTAGIYLARANKKTLIIEKETIGGQIASSPLVQNYPGIMSITGAELANNLYEQVESLNVDIELEEVLEIVPGEIHKVITDYNTYTAKTIILATGSKYRLLNIENEDNLLGKGIHFCVSCDGAFYKNKIVAVIGGGNSAITNAIYLAGLAKKVYLIHRKNKFNCEDKLVNELNKLTNIEILFNSVVSKIIGNDNLEEIVVMQEDKERKITIDGLFISIGMDAQTEIANNILELNQNKYIITDECKSSIPSIFVAGDCREKKLRQLATAINDGAISATLAINYLNSEEK